MAFTIASLTPIGGQGRRGVAPLLFMYSSTDALATIVASAYFNDLRDQVEVGDVVILSHDTGTTAALSIISFATVPKSPSVVAVTIDAADINAA